MSPSNNTLRLTLFIEFDDFLKTQSFLQTQLVDEKGRSCFSYSINIEATVKYFDVFAFFRFSFTLTYFKCTQTHGITFCHAIWKLIELTDVISRLTSHGLTEFFCYISNPWLDQPSQFNPCHGSESVTLSLQTE